MSSSFEGYSRLELSDVAEAQAAQLLQRLIEAIKAGKKKAKLEIEIEAKRSDDGKEIEIEIEMEAEEDGKKESKELEYTVPL